jgi:tetratricopeptide (TPR) repeat protein
MLKKIILFTFILIFLFQNPLLSQTRRIKLRVEGTDGKAIEGVKITLTSPQRSDFNKVVVTDEEGEVIFLLQMEIKNLNFLLEKEGYQVLQDSKELRTLRKSQELLYYEHTFTIYRTGEQTPEQTRRQYEINQQALSFFNKGVELFQTEDFLKAAEQFKKAAKTKPDFFQAYQNLAAAYFQAESYSEAIEAAEKALETEPESAQTLKLLSVAYSKLGDEKKALEYEEKLRELPEVELSPEELFNMGAAAANENRDEEAAEYFEKATELNPDYAQAYYHLGVIYFRLEKMEEAEKALRKYLELKPEGENAKNADTLLEYIRKSKK